MFRLGVALLALFLSGCGGPSRSVMSAGESATIECAPYARQLSGIQLYGDAASWWDGADGRYQRSAEPVQGGVLVFQRSARLPHGHVSVVSSIVSDREIRVSQANWVHGRITGDEPVVDVSETNDWSRVRVWWAPVQALGASTYAAYGFISPGSARSGAGPMASLEQR